jgi:serine/threonine protein kinase
MSESTAFGSKYLLGEVIGRGAVGRVHRASVRDGGADVAVKVLRDDLAANTGVVGRFLQERHVLRSIRHENVVRVHDLVVEGDRLGIVMDFVAGGDLRSVARMASPPGRAVALCAQIADALAAVHAAGVVHRDLKPENVLVETAADGSLLVKLTDFGVSHLVRNTLTRPTSLIGTPGYLAPEVTQGQRATPAADLYALGVILYELCCGVPPFEADNPLALIRAHAEDPIRRPDGMPDELWALIGQLLAKDPTARLRAVDTAARLRWLEPGLATLGPFPPPARVAIDPFRPAPRPLAIPAVPAGSIGAARDVPTFIPAGEHKRLLAPERRSSNNSASEAAPHSRRHHRLVGTTVLCCMALVVITFVVWGPGDVRSPKNLVAAQGATYSFRPVGYPGGIVMTRVWKLVGSSGDTLEAALTFTHSGDRQAPVEHFEVIPKTVAETVTDITFDPLPDQIVERDPIVRYDLRNLKPGASLAVSYTVKVDPAGMVEPRLARLGADQEKAEEIFLERHEKPGVVLLASLAIRPAEVVLSPGDRAHVALTGKMSDGSSAPDSALAGVTWVSTNPAVAVVTESLVTAIRPGIATVRAQAGDLEESLTVKVLRKEVAQASPGATATPKPTAASGGNPAEPTESRRPSLTTPGGSGPAPPQGASLPPTEASPAPPNSTTTTTVPQPPSAPPTTRQPPRADPPQVGPYLIQIEPPNFKQDSRWNVRGPRYDKPEDYRRNDATYTHAYGRDVGRFVYSFNVEPGAVGTATVSARVSSELPGGVTPQGDEASDVYVKMNGTLADVVTVIPDDQSGARVEWELNMAKLRVGSNTVEFGVAEDATNRHGLCIYWKPLKPGYEDEPITIAVVPNTDSEARATSVRSASVAGLLMVIGSSRRLAGRRRLSGEWAGIRR